MTRSRLRLHADASSIFNLGTAAVCLRCHRPKMVACFETASSDLAVAGQILDDLLDVEEDLARGRYNFVANFLGVTRPLAARARSRDRHIARAVLRGDAVGGVLDLVCRYVERAAEHVASARIPALDEYLAAYVAEAARIRGGVHRARVAHAFPGIGGLASRR